MKPKQWMIYGANGYTGELCAREAVARGMKPVLAGRNDPRVAALAAELGLEHRSFTLDDPAPAAAALEGVRAVLHCAGPFSATSEPMLEACTRARTHYLDITGEIGVFEHIFANASRWRDAGIAVIPGVGFDVVPSDCLAAMLKQDLPDARRLTLAFYNDRNGISPGTAKTVVEGMAKGCPVRVNGELRTIPVASKSRLIPFDTGERPAVIIPWGDVSTAWHSTGIPNIEVYLGMDNRAARRMRAMARFLFLLRSAFMQRLVKAYIGSHVRGPGEAERAGDASHLYGEVENAAGVRAARTLTTPNGYSLTVDASLHAVARVLEGIDPGAWTPSKALGPEFVLTLAGVQGARVR